MSIVRYSLPSGSPFFFFCFHFFLSFPLNLPQSYYLCSFSSLFSSFLPLPPYFLSFIHPIIYLNYSAYTFILALSFLPPALFLPFHSSLSSFRFPSFLSYSLFFIPIIILTLSNCPFPFFPPSRFSPLTFIFLRPVSLGFLTSFRLFILIVLLILPSLVFFLSLFSPLSPFISSSLSPTSNSSSHFLNIITTPLIL